MRGKITAGALVSLAFLVPASPAAAQTSSAGTSVAASCQTILYQDIRELVTIDLDTASSTEVKLVAVQISHAAEVGGLPTLYRVIQARLSGTEDDLRAFLKTKLTSPWLADLRLAVTRTLTNAGPNRTAAAQKALNDATVDALFTYLNSGQYIARAADAGTLKLYTDVRALVTIDVATASDADLQLLAQQILDATTADSLSTVRGALQAALNGTADDLRVFLRTNLPKAWLVDLRVAVLRTLGTAGANEYAAAQTALDAGTIDSLFSYLNNDRYVARASDCAYQPAA